VDLPHLWMGLFAVGREVSEFDLEALRTIETSTRVRSRRALAAAVMVSTGIWALAASFVSFGGMAHGVRAIWAAASLLGLASLVLGVILAANASVDVLTVADEQGTSVRIEVESAWSARAAPVQGRAAAPRARPRCLAPGGGVLPGPRGRAR